MGCAVVYSEFALNDLHEITVYIATDNAEAGKRFSNRLIDFRQSARFWLNLQTEYDFRRALRRGKSLTAKVTVLKRAKVTV